MDKLDVMIDRAIEQTSLLVEMCREAKNLGSNRFYEIKNKLHELDEIYKIEDQLNKGGVDNV